MAYITTLKLEDKVVIGGEEIAVHKWTIRNYHLFVLARIVTRLQLACTKMDSNNSSGGLVLSDAEAINMDWARFKIEWALALANKDLAPNAMETEYAILAITANEALRIPNERISRMVYGFGTLIQRLLFADSAKMQYGITSADEKKIVAQVGYVDQVLVIYAGDGTDKNRGLEVSAHVELGVVNPPIDLGEATVFEPSPAAPNTPTSDVPDTPSTVPLPGTSTGKN